MSQAEELLNGMSEEIPVHDHPVPDTDTYFIIDPITRKIENTNRKKNVIMQYDHNSERFTFELPRYIDGHDMLDCDSVTVNVDNIEVVESADGEEAVEPRVNSDAPDMTDLCIHPTDPEKVITSWLISRNSTQLAGILSFHIEFKCADANGNVVYEWSTDTFDEIIVKARKKNGEAAVVEHSDLLEQWRTRIFGAGDSVMANIAAEGKAQVAAVKAESETQQEAVELKGAQTLDAIPEEYTEVDAMADEAVRSKGDAIVCEAEGELITLKDSSDDHIRGLRLFGKSVQDATPTPDNPQEIVSIKNPTVDVYGKNLCPPSAFNVMNMNGSANTYDPSSNTITMDVDSATSSGRYCAPCKNLIVGKPYTLSFDIRGTAGKKVTCGWNVGKLYVTLTNEYVRYSSTIIASHPSEAIIFYSYVASGGGLLSGEFIQFANVQIEFGETATGYEPYKSVQSLAIPHTLHGLPVNSGGNYTDSDGRQWICDEVDLERGVYVQRCFKTSDFKANNEQDGFIQYRASFAATPIIPESRGLLNVTDRWSTAVFNGTTHCLINTSGTAVYVYMPSDYDINIKPIEFIGCLETPIETPLTAEEIAAFKALRTNYPNTTILNDAGAWMSVKYNADTKAYVDKPKTLRLTDTSTGVVYELKIVDGALAVVPV